jgi:hypothetical protein
VWVASTNRLEAITIAPPVPTATTKTNKVYPIANNVRLASTPIKINNPDVNIVGKVGIKTWWVLPLAKNVWSASIRTKITNPRVKIAHRGITNHLFKNKRVRRVVQAKSNHWRPKEVATVVLVENTKIKTSNPRVKIAPKAVMNRALLPPIHRAKPVQVVVMLSVLAVFLVQRVVWVKHRRLKRLRVPRAPVENTKKTMLQRITIVKVVRTVSKWLQLDVTIVQKENTKMNWPKRPAKYVEKVDTPMS